MSKLRFSRACPWEPSKILETATAVSSSLTVSQDPSQQEETRQTDFQSIRDAMTEQEDEIDTLILKLQCLGSSKRHSWFWHMLLVRPW